MKKIISLSLSLLFVVAMLTGCGFFEHNYERDYSQVIATIKPITQEVKGKRVVLGDDGLPVYDLDGQVVYEDVNTTYTSKEIKIYKSQLVNYANNNLANDLNAGLKLNRSINNYFDTLVKYELLLLEADKLFDAQILYWTEDDVDAIQRSVYQAINDELFEIKNQLLKENGLPEISKDEENNSTTSETTYPLPPEEVQEERISPRYNIEKTNEHQWFDAWYTNSTWYIEDAKYKNTYPGLYGTPRSKSLASEAFTKYVDQIIENSDNLIGLDKEQKQIIKKEVEKIQDIRHSQGIEYVYPILGKTLLMKYMVGNTYLKNLKLIKLSEHITEEISTVTQGDIVAYYNRQLTEQKSKFAKQSDYDSAINGSDPILYFPTDRYVFVKHILLPFSEEQTAELDLIKKQEGSREDRIIQRRAKLAREIIVYPHVNGEDDLSRPMTVKQVTKEIASEMNRLKNSPELAEKKFTDFIYKYNTDPGIFTKEQGYAVVYKLGEGENETYMTEFAEAARAFRDEYNVGEIYYDKEIPDEDGNPVPYIITDYGIHIMYYLMDPAAGTVRGLNDYTTPGKFTKIYDLMKEGAMQEKKAEKYEIWEDRYLVDTQEKSLKTNQKVIDKFIKELNKYYR